MNITETTEPANIAFGGTQIWSPDFQTMPLTDIPKAIRHNEQWKPYGYNRAILWREARTLFLYRAE